MTKHLYCSHCQKYGHKESSCFEKEDSPLFTLKEKDSHASVVIKVESSLPVSPYKVELGGAQGNTSFEQVSVVKPHESHQKREVVDFASLVKKANEDQKKFEAHKKSLDKLLEKSAPAAPVVRKELQEPAIQIHEEVQEETPYQFSPEVEKIIEQKKLRKKKPFRGRKKMSLPSVSLPSVSVPKLSFSAKTFVSTVVLFAILFSVPYPVIAYYKKVKTSQETVIEKSTVAFSLLQSSTIAALQANMPAAEQGLQGALEGFSQAEEILMQEHTVLTSIADIIPVVGSHIRSGEQLLRAGQHLALGNTYLIKGVSSVTAEGDAPVSDKISVIKRHLQYAIPQYEKALEEFAGVDPKVLPVEYQTSFAEAKLLLATFVDDLKDLRDLADAMHFLFGGEDLQRYMVVFQNHHEIRATGGFIGSFAIVDVQKGRIVNIEVPEGGSYDLNGQLKEHVVAPVPLQLVNGQWQFQDANWFPDFPSSAQKMAWFYEQSRGASIDGVIAINATVLERFLRVIGPVHVDDKYDVLLDADSVLATLQTEVETGEDKAENKPKRIISVMLAQLLEQLPTLEHVQLMSLLAEVHDSVQEKEIQVYSFNDTYQEKIHSFGWSGEMLQTQSGQDYLYVVNTNLQGQKSDARMTQDIDYHVQVQENGDVYGTLKVTRTHTGTPGEQFYGKANINFLRVYVPEGAELVDASGFEFPPEEAFHAPESYFTQDTDLANLEKEEGYDARTGTRITREFGKTAFGNWMIVYPGEQVEATFVYKLPFKANMEREQKESSVLDALAGKQHLAHKYSLVVQKQSGVESTIETSLSYPKQWMPVWKSEGDITFDKHGYGYRGTLDQDTMLGVVMQKDYE